MGRAIPSGSNQSSGAQRAWPEMSGFFFEGIRNKTPIPVWAEQFPRPFLHSSGPLRASTGSSRSSLRSCPRAGGSQKFREGIGDSLLLNFSAPFPQNICSGGAILQQSLVIPAWKRFRAGKIPSLALPHLPTAGRTQNSWNIGRFQEDKGSCSIPFP